MLGEHGYDVCFLDESSVMKPGVTNVRSMDILKIVNAITFCEVIHIHTSIDWLRICYLLAGKVMRKKTVVTIHSWRGKSRFDQVAQKMVLRTANMIVCVNDDIGKDLNLNNVVVRNAFIPPKMMSQPTLPKEVEHWLKDRIDAGKKIISSNAFRLNKHNGVDLYGLDMIIELATFLLNDKKQNVAFVFCVASVNDVTEESYQCYSALIDQYGLNSHFLLLRVENLSFIRILLNSSLTIRATNTDGDALSIRESLHFGVPVIASNCVKRPTGTITFETRSQIDLNNTVLATLEKCDSNNTATGSTPASDDFDFYNGLYAG